MRMLLPRSVRTCVGLINNVLVDDFDLQEKGSRTLFITFAGMAGILKTLASVKQRIGIETRPFEFVHSLQDKQCDVMFLRDRHRAYYHSGVRGVGRNIDEVAGFLNYFVAKRNYDLVVTLGHSMGGYASLLFASKIKADLCIAISPQTFLDLENRTLHGDDRYDEEKRRLYESRRQSSSCYDLRQYFLSKANSGKSCTYCVFYGENDRLDKVHATRMTGLNQTFHLYEVKGAGHNAAREMRNSGLLLRLFDNILSFNNERNVDALLCAINSEASIRQPLSSSQSQAT